MDKYLDSLIIKHLNENNQLSIDKKFLSSDDILEIKKLAREKRLSYGLAPIGDRIFSFIMEQEKNLFFEIQNFKNEDLNALIFVPNPKNNDAYIILNGNQPLINQIFATAHEYYHFLVDLDKIKKNPQLCYMSKNKLDKSEQMASRFAAEFLLPEEALNNEVNKWKSYSRKSSLGKATNSEIWAFVSLLTIKYYIPLKASLYRLYEEDHIKEYDKYLERYEEIKKIFIKYTKMQQATELIYSENKHIEISINKDLYNIIPKAYESGFVSKDELDQDIGLLNLKKEIINDSIDKEEIIDEEEDDDLLELILNNVKKRDDLI